MRKLLIAIFLLFVIANCQHHNKHADDDDNTVFPFWKLKIVLRDNGQGCYQYQDGCDYACPDDCVTYNGDGLDEQLKDYQYCCPSH